MFKTLVFSLLVVGGIASCATNFEDSAPASQGGRYVAGSYDNKRAMFYCSAKSSESECRKIKVNINR